MNQPNNQPNNQLNNQLNNQPNNQDGCRIVYQRDELLNMAHFANNNIPLLFYFPIMHNNNQNGAKRSDV